MGGVRTAVGAFCGAFESTPAAVLGSTVVKAPLRGRKLKPATWTKSSSATSSSAGLGQNVARQVSIGARPQPGRRRHHGQQSLRLGPQSVMLAAQAIQCGDASVVVAGGTENMSRAPYLLEKARSGYRMGNGELVDSMIRDGLWDVYNNVHMGTCGDRCAEKYNFTRAAAGRFRRRQLQAGARAAAAAARFAEEIVPVEVKAGKEIVTVDRGRERPRSSTRRNCASFARPSARRARSRPAMPRASTTARRPWWCCRRRRSRHWASSRRPRSWATPPSRASRNGSRLRRSARSRSCCEQLSLKVADVDLFEINEAFAVVPMAAMKELGIPHEKVNVHGGAVALGHPIGASGARRWSRCSTP